MVCFQRSGEELHPVMVWIHGGGFNGGTNFEYPGYFMAEKDVVYVALNYRLGMLGNELIHTRNAG